MTKSWRSQFGNIKTLDFYNADIATAYEPIWDQGGAYTFPIAAGVQLSVASDDAADTSAGTGARTVRVKGLLPTGVAFEEDVILTGTTEVPLSNALVMAVNSIEVLTVGTGGQNAGNIYVGDGTFTLGVPAEKFCKILDFKGKSAQGVYSFPAGSEVRFHALNAGSGLTVGTDVTVRLKYRVDRGPWLVSEEQPISVGWMQNQHIFPELLGNGQVDVVVEAVASTGTEPVGGDAFFTF
jgi:hypothetical protein